MTSLVKNSDITAANNWANAFYGSMVTEWDLASGREIVGHYLSVPAILQNLEEQLHISSDQRTRIEDALNNNAHMINTGNQWESGEHVMVVDDLHKAAQTLASITGAELPHVQAGLLLYLQSANTDMANAFASQLDPTLAIAEKGLQSTRPAPEMEPAELKVTKTPFVNP